MQNRFDIEIYPRKFTGGGGLKELWQYRDMVLLFVRRDWIANYKQTILGPLWAIIQPVVTAIVNAFIFGSLANLSSTGVPIFLFYFSSQIMWGFFSSCLTGASNTFVSNRYLLSRVYFPRIVLPVSNALSRLISLAIQAATFIAIYIISVLNGADISLNAAALLIPLHILHLGLLGVGVGGLLSALTKKYRDILMIINFAVTLWMYLTPVVYGIEKVPQQFSAIILFNPCTSIILNLRYGIFNSGEAYWGYYALSWAVTLIVFFLGVKVLKKTAFDVIDTI